MLVPNLFRLINNAVGALRSPQYEATASGAITLKSGSLFITKSGSLAALTLAAPTAGVDDGKRLRIYGVSAFAHTVTQTTPGFDSGGTASDVATFATTGGCLSLEAYNGVWRVCSTYGVTLA